MRSLSSVSQRGPLPSQYTTTINYHCHGSADDDYDGPRHCVGDHCTHPRRKRGTRPSPRAAFGSAHIIGSQAHTAASIRAVGDQLATSATSIMSNV